MPRIRWAMIFMCFLANVINFIDRANLAIAAPGIRADLGLDAVGMGLVLSAFFWTYAFLQLPAGWFIDKVGLRGFEHHYPKMLSGGMQQRTAIARALANEPRILLLDEPFGALDNQTRSLMQELLLSIWESERKTVLFVTHDIEEAIFMANRVLVMSARPGRIKAEVAVPLGHPRHYTVKTSPEFSALKADLTEQIRVEALKAA